MMTSRTFPSGFLPFLFIPVLVAFFSAAVVSAQDRPVSETAGKSVSLDPILGRFLNPDPFVQAPGFTQNYNRFAYALNNPLVYSDESGEFAITMMLIAGGITAALFGGGNLAAHAIRKDDLGHGNWAKYFFSGAVAGFIVGVSAYSGFAGLQGLSNMSGFLGTFEPLGNSVHLVVKQCI